MNTTPAFASKVIVPALAEFYRSHPDLLLSLDATEKVVDLRRGDADLAIRYGRGDHSPLSSQALATDCYLPVCSPQLAEGRPFTPDEVAQSKLLQFAWRNEHLGGPTWGRWMAAAGVDGFEETRCLTLSEESLVNGAARRRHCDSDPAHCERLPTISVGQHDAQTGNAQTSDGEALRRLALAGVGLARLAAFQVREDVAAGRLRPVLENFNPGDSEEVHAIYVGQGGYLPLRVRAFLDFLVERVDIGAGARGQAV